MAIRLPTGLRRSHPVFVIATWFYAGLLPAVPGTWGSLAALPILWLVSSSGGVAGVASFALLVGAVGLWASHRYAQAAAQHDPSSIVVDEVVGQAIALIAVGPDAVVYAVGFVAFRVLDIVKPWPISWADRRLAGGVGIMLDDIFAGAIAAPLVWLFARHWGAA